MVAVFDLQRRVWTEASNDRVWQHPATTATRISLRRLADYRNADGHISFWSAPATAAATAAACGGWVSVWQHSDSTATGWRIVVRKYPTACTINWWIVWRHYDPATSAADWWVIWKHHNPATARSRWIFVREYHNSTSPGWRTLWCTTTRSTTAGRFAFWRHTTTGPAAGDLSFWQHPATRNRTDVIHVWDDTTATYHRDFTVW